MNHQGGRMSQNRMTIWQNENNPHELNRALRSMTASASPIYRTESNQRVPAINFCPRREIDHNIVPTNDHHNVSGFPREPNAPILGMNTSLSSSSNQSFSTRLFGSTLLLNQRGDNIITPSHDRGVMGTNSAGQVNNGYNRDNMSLLGSSLHPHGPEFQRGNSSFFAQPQGYVAAEQNVGDDISANTWRLPVKRRSPENSSLREYAIGESSAAGARAQVEIPRRRVLSDVQHRNETVQTHNNNLQSYYYHHNLQQEGASSQAFVPPNMRYNNSHVPLPIQQQSHPFLSHTQTPPFAASYSAYPIEDVPRFLPEAQQTTPRMRPSAPAPAPAPAYVHTTVNVQQYVRISPEGVMSRFVAPSIARVLGSSHFHPSPLDPWVGSSRQNLIPPWLGDAISENNQRVSVVGSGNRVVGNVERILTSTSPELRSERNRLRDQIYGALQRLRNGGSMAIEELLILDYSIVLSLLDAQERLDQLSDSEDWPFEVINMALEEQMSSAEMGLTEEEILTYIGDEIFQSTGDEFNETCTICQEDFINGEQIGRLDCDHIYHLACIKQWLVLKNICPICKQTALDVEDEEDESEE